jgi:hypothetical protein
MPQPRSTSRLILTAYAVHLLLPGLALLDVVSSWANGLAPFSIRSSEAVIAASSVAWLVGGLGGAGCCP